MINREINAEDITLDFIKSRPLSKSSLSAFNVSPKHYVKYLNEKKDSSGFLLGSLIDCIVLEPEKFENKYYVYEKPDLRTKVGKQAKESTLLIAKNRTLITKEDYQKAKYAKESLMDLKESRDLIEKSFNIQKKLTFTDAKTKLPLIGYQDFQSSAWDSNLLVDLKTSRTAEPDKFNRLISDYDYDLQNAVYLAYYRRRLQFPDFIFLTVETDDPYNVSITFCDSKFNQKAHEAFRGSLMAFKKALEPTEDKPNHFHMGYEFKLMGSLPYFTASLPPWKKPAYQGFDE